MQKKLTGFSVSGILDWNKLTLNVPSMASFSLFSEIVTVRMVKIRVYSNEEETSKSWKHFTFFSLLVHALFPHDCLHSIKKLKVCWETPPIKNLHPTETHQLIWITNQLTGSHVSRLLIVKCFPKKHWIDLGSHHSNKPNVGNILFAQSTRAFMWVPIISCLFKSSQGFFLFHF